MDRLPGMVREGLLQTSMQAGAHACWPSVFSSLLQSYRRVLHPLAKDLEATRSSQFWRSILPVS